MVRDQARAGGDVSIRRTVSLLLVAIAVLAAAPALACTVAVPYRPLLAVTAGTSRTLPVVVQGTEFRNGVAFARVKLVRVFRGTSRQNVVLKLPYLQPVCGQSREPEAGQKLIVYVSANRAVGWATIQEACRFDPLVR